MNKKHSVGQLSSEYLSRVPHHILPSLNLHSSLPTDDDLLLDEFPYYLTTPTPFTSLEQASLVLSSIDPVASLVRRKIKWELRKEKLLKNIRADKRSKTMGGGSGEQRRRGGVSAVPRGVAMLARHMDADPDPAFNGAPIAVYNWYYTGGTLASLELNEDHYLLYSSSTHGEIKMCDAQAEKCGLPAVISLDYNEPVHQIVTNSMGGAAARQQRRVHILAAGEETGKPGLSRVCSVEAGKRDGFVSVALPRGGLTQFCTLGTKGVLRLWDAEVCRMRAKVGGRDRGWTDSWGSVVFHDDNTLILTDRCCVHIYDIRAGVKRQRSWCPVSLLEQCQQLSLLVGSRRSPDHAFYAATSHQLLLLDCRSGFMQCWTHMLAAPPYLGCAQLIENNVELVCLGSESPGECVVVTDPWSSPARLLPSPATSLIDQRRHGHCLHPALNARCMMSQTGLAAVPADDGVRVFRQTASGDVFTQIVARTTRLAHSPDREWGVCGEISLQPQPASIDVTRIQDFRPLLTVLSGKDPLPTKTTEQSRTGSGWKVSKKYLEDCVDLMAESVLKVWEIEEEDEWLEEEEVEDIGEDDPGERVLNWLGAADNGPDLRADGAVNDHTRENTEMYPSTLASQILDTIKTEPEFDMTSTWDFPLTQQLKRMHPSPARSEKEVMQIEKKSKTFDESFLSLTPAKPPLSSQKAVPSVKKKFIPGF